MEPELRRGRKRRLTRPSRRLTESLPVDQLLLALEEAEQVEAEGLAREELEAPAKREVQARRRRANCGALPAHLPLYRQAQIYGRQGVSLDRSTLADWVGKAAFLLRPVHARLFERLKASGKLFADETTAPVLDPGRGRTKTGQLLAYARYDRPWGGSDPPGVAYLYAPDRKAAQPIRHLAGFVGTLQVDGYAGYRALAEATP